MNEKEIIEVIRKYEKGEIEKGVLDNRLRRYVKNLKEVYK